MKDLRNLFVRAGIDGANIMVICRRFGLFTAMCAKCNTFTFIFYL